MAATARTGPAEGGRDDGIENVVGSGTQRAGQIAGSARAVVL